LVDLLHELSECGVNSSLTVKCYAVSPERYEQTIQLMVDDVRDECEGLNEEKIK
jgi:hypothetical protein